MVSRRIYVNVTMIIANKRATRQTHDEHDDNDNRDDDNKKSACGGLSVENTEKNI